MPDRRVSTRYRLKHELPCNVNVALGGSSWSAALADISMDGIGIISGCWLPPETTILVELGDSAPVPRVFLAHLCHATRRPTGDFHLGARLVNHLTEQEIFKLIQGTKDSPD